MGEFTLPKRKSLRLANYDYSQTGLYFVTLCIDGRKHLLGEVEDDRVLLSPLGVLVESEWLRSGEIRAEVELDDFVVMPNHFHAVVLIQQVTEAKADSGRANSRSPLHMRPRSLSSLVAGFKAATTARHNTLAGMPGRPLWQRGFHDHIIRNEDDLARIRHYVTNNPAKWLDDCYHPSKV